MLNHHPDKPQYSLAPHDNYLTDPAWVKGFGLLEKYNLSFKLQVLPHQMHRLLKLKLAIIIKPKTVIRFHNIHTFQPATFEVLPSSFILLIAIGSTLSHTLHATCMHKASRQSASPCCYLFLLLEGVRKSSVLFLLRAHAQGVKQSVLSICLCVCQHKDLEI